MTISKSLISKPVTFELCPHIIDSLLCSQDPIFFHPWEKSLAVFKREYVFELQPFLRYQAYCTGRYSKGASKWGVIFNSHKSRQQDTAMPFLTGIGFRILTISTSFFSAYLPSHNKKYCCLVSLVMWEDANESSALESLISLILWFGM